MNFDFLSGINALGSGVLGFIVPFLFVLTLVVFFHELGHFLIARWCGVKVLVFSIGFGPELFGFNDRHHTRWKISAIPLGGYVKFFGDDNAASVPDQAALAHMTEQERQASFIYQPVARRAAIVVDFPPPATFTVSPCSATESIASLPHEPDSRRISARSVRGIRTLQLEVGDAVSSDSLTGWRYGAPEPPNTSAAE